MDLSSSAILNERAFCTDREDEERGCPMGEGITVVGLGTEDPRQMTVEAWEILTEAPRVFMRTKNHPAAKALLERGVPCEFFDGLDEEAIGERLIQAGKAVYAVPGDPRIGEASVDLLLAKGVPVRLIPGTSFPGLYSLRGGLVVMDAADVDGDKLPLSLPIVIMGVDDQLPAKLLRVYPPGHPVRIVREGEYREAPLGELDQAGGILIIPPLRDVPTGSLAPLLRVMAALRGENGCPWDKKQDHRSLRPYVIEEAYEVVEAVDQDSMDKLCEELGDLLLQVVFHAHLAWEAGHFDVADVVDGITAKMIRRHPHVFGDISAADVPTVLRNWEAIKRAEGKERSSLLDGIPDHYPALMKALKLQQKAAMVGFDWPDVQGVLEKLEEEWEEVQRAFQAGDESALEEEFGDLLFTLVNLARFYRIDPEVALHRANQKFSSRFRQMEKDAQTKNQELADLSLDEQDLLWESAKERE
ncbi:MAG: nucleoside triphosphate pyrophosphohydrolase [Firmicutes bacterium]|jgi:tetrapyrrole methylase family protein/MazG family protein|nr:nucleoside triphosphate pyrophosphohydrolase [Bacillota bacterium]